MWSNTPEDYTSADGLLSPAAIVSVINGSFITSLMNFNIDQKIVSNNEPINLEPYVEQVELNVRVSVNSLCTRTDIYINFAKTKFHENLKKYGPNI